MFMPKPARAYTYNGRDRSSTNPAHIATKQIPTYLVLTYSAEAYSADTALRS